MAKLTQSDHGIDPGTGGATLTVSLREGQEARTTGADLAARERKAQVAAALARKALKAAIRSLGESRRC